MRRHEPRGVTVIGFHWHSHLHVPNPTGVASLSLDGAAASVQDVHRFLAYVSLMLQLILQFLLQLMFASFVHFISLCSVVPLCNLELRAKRVSFSSLKTP